MTAREYRAIGYYASHERVRLSLSVPPYITFVDDSNTREVHLRDILDYYDNGRKEDAKERRRKKLASERANGRL